MSPDTPSRVTHNGRQWSNAAIDPIELTTYDPNWPTLFATEAALIQQIIPSDLDVIIEHFGSTAIPNLAAKPIIDIMLIIAARNRWPELIAPLQALDYLYWAENPEPNHFFFVKGMPPFGTGRTHHLHIHLPVDAQAALRFRDYLRVHPYEAQRYATLKAELAQRHRTDREAYTNAKAEFVARILALRG